MHLTETSQFIQGYHILNGCPEYPEVKHHISLLQHFWRAQSVIAVLWKQRGPAQLIPK